MFSSEVNQVQRVAHIVRENAEETIAVARCPVGKAPGNFGDSLVNGLVEEDHLVEMLLFGCWDWFRSTATGHWRAGRDIPQQRAQGRSRNLAACLHARRLSGPAHVRTQPCSGSFRAAA